MSTFTVFTVGKPNSNGRIYTKEVVQKVFDDLKKPIDERRAFVSLPEEPDSIRVNVSDVAALITSEVFDGERLSIDVEILETVKGRAVKGMLGAGLELDVFASGLGSVNPETMEIMGDYTLSHLVFDLKRENNEL